MTINEIDLKIEALLDDAKSVGVGWGCGCGCGGDSLQSEVEYLESIKLEILNKELTK